MGIPFDPHSEYHASQMREAASKVLGLHQETSFGPKTQTIFMGWDSAAVRKKAKGHAKKEAKSERENESAELHADYLRTLERKGGPKRYSPVGSYIVDCKKIKEQWPHEADDLSLDIRPTKEPGIFEASFDFGILEGVMIICAEKTALEQYCYQLDREADSSSDDEEENDWGEEEGEDDKKPKTGSKRKAKTPQGRGRPSKKSKGGAAQPRTYLLKLKCRETGEGEIQCTAENGTLTFPDEKLASILGKTNLPYVGRGVPFTARKISDTPSHSENSWADYSERAYEYARVSRWK